MALNYCVNCGAKLEEGNTHCNQCGEDVVVGKKTSESFHDEEDFLDEIDGFGEEDEPFTKEIPADTSIQDEDFSSFADLSGFDVFTTETATPPHTTGFPDQTDVMLPLGGMRSAAEYRAPKAEKNYLAVPVKIALGVAAAILVVAGIGLLAQPGTINNIQQYVQNASSRADNADTNSEGENEEVGSTSGANSEGDASTSDVNGVSVSDAKAAVDDDTAFDYLLTTYDKLQSYNDRVYSCLQTYNSVIVASDRAQREAASGIASSLLAEIDKDISTLDAMNIGRASDLYDDYENVRNLLNDQYMRLAVVVESWEISLKYDTPYEHQTEILEPLTRDIGISGQNTYLEDFDANYWNSRPTR